MRSRKGQIDVDIIISYIVFVFFLVFTIGFMFDLTDPLFNTVNQDVIEKQSLALYDTAVPSMINQQEFSEICKTGYKDLMGSYVEYKVNGFYMPASDYERELNATNGEVLFVRDNYDLKVIGSSNSTNYTATIYLVYPGYVDVSVEDSDSENETLSQDYTYDNSSITTNTFENNVVFLNFTFGPHDIDKYTIHSAYDSNYFIMLKSFDNFDLNKSYVGKIKMNDYCGEEANGRESFVQGYSLLSRNQNIVSAKIEFSGWWAER